MPMYGFICINCGTRAEEHAPMSLGPPQVACSGCGGVMNRDYRGDAPAIKAVPQATYNPSLGIEVSDQRQVTEAMKRMTEESVRRTGYEPKLVAMHPSEVAPAGPSHVDPTGQAFDNAMKAAHDGAKMKPNKATASPAA